MEIKQLVTDIEQGTLPYENWNHSNHLLLALYYVFTEEDVYTSLAKTKCSLIRYATLVNPKYDCTLRYNETITVFWIYQMKEFISKNPDKNLEELVILLQKSELRAKEYIYKFYDRETVHSTNAQATYISPWKKVFQ